MPFGKRLRRVRLHTGKTQKELAVATGIPQTTISGWETGPSEPQVSELHLLAKALGIAPLELLDDKDDSLPRKDKSKPGQLD